MKKSIAMLGLIIVFVAFASNADKPKTNIELESLGEKLVVNLWEVLAKGDVETAEKMMAEGFQSVHKDGTRNIKEELSLIKGLDLSEYQLGDFLVTNNGPTILVTYNVTVSEIINTKRVPKNESMRMTVFVKTDNGWKWFAHANVNPLK
ncbi:nuclear transport factor 2 family protein [bacterium]|nr:nuclear transport factor 2 family protein [bacterium]